MFKQTMILVSTLLLSAAQASAYAIAEDVNVPFATLTISAVVDTSEAGSLPDGISSCFTGLAHLVVLPVPPSHAPDAAMAMACVAR
ncbi:hypothetical protein [Aestuariibius sp. HNIBRBA575]|uniref:hypothetical protein n=1 Tax=Aestuariibius sp. HNIBRBA575 TaxID=3233343 RepID=UPI0034A19A65